jgi:hypothetical protein
MAIAATATDRKDLGRLSSLMGRPSSSVSLERPMRALLNTPRRP